MTNVLEYLEQSTNLHKDKIAVADEHTNCTYSELVQQAKAVGSTILPLIHTNKAIPIFMEKSVNAIIAFMGVVYAGGFYVLLDPTLPIARLNQIIDALGADTILVDQKYTSQLTALDFKRTVVDLDKAKVSPINTTALNMVRAKALDTDPLYGIFTSGSTGVPKGVVVCHRSVIDFMEHFTDLFDITENDIIGNQAPFDFDVSVKDIYSTFKTGATLQIIPKKLFSMPALLLDFLDERQVTTLIWAVSALCIITTLKGFTYKVPTKINKVLFSGEVMPIKHLNEWQKYLPQVSYVNLYGPTEITCNCTYYKVDKTFEVGEILPIGVAFPNENVFLLDENDNLITAPDVLGELCVSGTCLALGYYNNPEQTQKAFVQNPLNNNYPETIYRTGDLSYYGNDGLLYFASRKDFQIKHMGHRIELGEIEAALEKVPAINRLCCVFDERKKRIIAFYEGDIERKEIISHIGTSLPQYMIPNVFKKLDTLPITNNGKTNRKLLLEQYQEGKL